MGSRGSSRRSAPHAARDTTRRCRSARLSCTRPTPSGSLAWKLNAAMTVMHAMLGNAAVAAVLAVLALAIDRVCRSPAVRHVAWLFTPGEEVLEAVCNENNKFPEYTGVK